MHFALVTKLLSSSAWIIPVAAAGAWLWNGFPSALAASSYDQNTVFAVTAALLAFILPSAAPPSRILARFLILAATSLPVSHVWASAMCNGAVMAGVLPQSDAGGYLSNAIAILSGRPSWDFASRPIFFAALAPLVLATGFNLKLLVAVLTLGNAVTLAVTVERVRDSLGGAAAGVFAFGGLCLCRMTAGWLMTEQFGILLGMTATALLLSGCRTGSPPRMIQSLFILGLALLCRAGAFFSLPTLALGITWMFAPCAGWRARIRTALLCGAAFAAAVATDMTLACGVYAEGKSPTSNFWYVAWGVLNDTDWKAADVRFNSQTNAVKDAVIKQASQEPWRMVTGAQRAIRAGFEDDYFFRHLGYSLPTVAVLKGLFLAGILAFFCARTRHLAFLALLVFLGVIPSLPFAPPWDGGIRIHAAVLPMLTVLPALGAALIATSLRDVLSSTASLRKRLLTICALTALLCAVRTGVALPLCALILLGVRRWLLSSGGSVPPVAAAGSKGATENVFRLASSCLKQMPAAAWVVFALTMPLPLLCKAIGAANAWPGFIASKLSPSADGVIDPGFEVRVMATGKRYLPEVSRELLGEQLKNVPWDRVSFTPKLLQAPVPWVLKCVFIPEQFKSLALRREVMIHRFALCIAPPREDSQVTTALVLPKDDYWNVFLLLDKRTASTPMTDQWRDFADAFH